MQIGDILSMNAYRFPDKIALITGEGNISYRQLEETANQIANVLIGLGVKKGQRVAIIEKTSARCIEATLAIVKTGAILANINNLLGPRELREVLNDCDPTVLIFGKSYENLVREVREDLPGIRHYLCLGCSNWAPDLNSEIKSASIERPKVNISEEEIFTLLYTAGTTGEPKAALYTHSAFWRNLLTTVIDTYKQTYNDIWIGPVPMYHIGGYGALMRILLMSNTFILKDKFDPSNYLATIEEEKVTILYAYPTMINAMIQSPEANEYDNSSLRLVIYGGSPIPETTLEKAHKIFQCDFLQRYGATECCGSAILILSPEQHRQALLGTKSDKKKLKSAGKPCLGSRVKLLDEKNRAVKVPGKTGTLVAHLDAPMKGYWRAPDETAKILNDGWLRLGDIAKFDEDGFFYLVDREKDIIVSGARNIYPREVEEILYSHPGIKEVSVIGVPDDYWGEAVKAVVVLKPGIKIPEEELINYCKQGVASYKKPKSVDFVDFLPKNAGGKILKKELRKKYWKNRDRSIH
jgi:acyl-CoA synthetase (AMP-forming)/AMP-acid ligase II